ncbi:tetratricopeptide repeat protein [Streptomyces sp. NPDC002870]|uniref:tetratricopeptide repeat protein n=1 Tax=Streptomyces sp. NPDC002870 TaxID=3364666 RepID=UPI0036C36A7E
MIGLALLAGLWWVGDRYQKPPLWRTDTDWPDWLQWLQDVWNAVAQVFGGAAQLVTHRSAGAPLSVRIAVLALLIAAFWALRRALLARNAYQPGPVDVQPLVDATPEGTSKPGVEDLTARFRKHVSETDLYPPSALPAEPPAENFLDLLGDVNLEAGKLGTSLLHLFSRLRPKIAYRVSGVLQRSAPGQTRCCGVTVTVTSYATRGSRAHTVWEPTWEKAVYEAGCWVMATILPVTRASKMPPWQAWRGKTLPADLFAAYQQGRQLSRERKFDEALQQFYKAVRWDPTNLYLRTQIAEIQEKLGLYLDALETYHGALTLGGLSTEEENTRLWGAPWRLRRFTYLWHWRHRPGVLLARYRYAVVLGTAEMTARQWCHERDDETHPRRAVVREEIRQALTPAFADRYWPAVVGLLPHYRQPLEKAAARRCIMRELNDKRVFNVRLLFQLACLQEIRRLAQDYTLASLYSDIRADKKALTRIALRINRDVWAPLRLAWSHPRGSKEGGMEWPPNDLKKRVKRARTRFLRERHKDWVDHYNAACVYAVAMHAPGSDGSRDEFAQLAFQELGDAVRDAESSFVMLKRSWVLAQDPDLAPLRTCDWSPRLARFEREAYPHSTPNRERFDDPRPVRVEMAISNSQLLQDVAGVMEQTWHRRNSPYRVEVHDVITWFEDEKSVWECLYRVTSSQARNWPDRENLLQRVREIVDPELMVEIPARVPVFNDITDDDEGWGDRSTARKRMDGLDRRFSLLGQLVKPDGGISPTACSTDWLNVMKEVDAGEQTGGWDTAIRKACADYAAIWQTVRDLAVPTDEDPGPLIETLKRRLRAACYESRVLRDA